MYKHCMNSCRAVTVEYRSIRQTAERWCVSIRWLQVFCKEKRIPGAFCVENIWVILSDAERKTNSQKSTSISFSVIGMSRILRLLSRNAMLILRSVNTARMIRVTDKIFISE